MNFKISLFITSIILLFSGLSTSLIAQDIDSLYQALDGRTEKMDTSIVEVYLSLSFAYRDIDTDSSIKYIDLARNLSKKIDYKKGEYHAIRNKGLLLIKENKYDSAISLLTELIEYCKKDSIVITIADAYNTLGTAYFHKAEYDSALEAYINSKDLYSALGRKLDVAGSLVNIASIQDEKGLRTIAMESFQDALMYFKEVDYNYGIATSSYNLAKILKEEGDYYKALRYMKSVAELDSSDHNVREFANSLSELAGLHLLIDDTIRAIQYYQRALNLSDSVEDPCLKSKAYVNLGSIYSFGDSKKAESYINNSLNILKECKSVIPNISIRNVVSNYFYRKEQYASAIKYSLKAFELAEENDILNLKKESSERLYQSYKKLGNSDKALYYFEICQQMDDLLYSQENTRKIAQLEAEYEMENQKREHELAQQKTRLEYQQQLKYEQQKQFFYIIGTILLIIFILIILYLLYQRNKANRNMQVAYKNQRKLNSKILDQHEKIKQQSTLLKEKSADLENQKEELQASNEALHELNVEKNNIIGIVAHDLKSPLNHIVGLIKVIQTGKQDEQSVKRFFKNIEDSALRSKKMIDKILDISSIENRMLNIDKTDVRLLDVLSEVLLEHSIYADAKSIELSLDYDADIIINTDDIMFREIIDNIISNAIKYSPQGTSVKINIKASEAPYKIDISDEGPGIDEEDLIDIFDHYKTTKNKSTADERSTGLGLAIVKKYSDALDYQIEVKKNKDSGSTFTVVLS